MSLAYTALVFLAVTLSIGPFYVLFRRPMPVNSYLRRDVGIWAGVLALTHMLFGVTMHTDNLQLWTLWLVEAEGGGWTVRDGWFGIANFTGLAQSVILILVLFISNDVMLRRLGVKRWKNLQRLTYLALLLILLHGFAFHRAENRDTAVRVIFLTIIGVTILIQTAGFVAVWRKKRAITALLPSSAGH